jgi:formylmethanofuran dehydrogenase subunit D
MARLGFNSGDKLRLKNHIGEVVVTCVPKKATDLPQGMIFIAYGPTSSRLMESDTAGSGMPLSKHISVQVEKIG